MSGYLVKEMFGPTLQGEGAHAGRACVFLRFAACNLACTWCDTDFRPEGAARMTADEIVARLAALDEHRRRMVVVHRRRADAAVGRAARRRACAAPASACTWSPTARARSAAPVDWLTVSPKPQFHGGPRSLVARAGDECKVVVDDTVDDEALDRYEHASAASTTSRSRAWTLATTTTSRARSRCPARRPRWRLSLQLHKIIGVP